MFEDPFLRHAGKRATLKFLKFFCFLDSISSFFDFLMSIHRIQTFFFSIINQAFA